MVFALQFPKIGLGFSAANAIAYVDVLQTIGQTAGSAALAQFCSTYNVAASIGAGVEAQVGPSVLGLALASPRKIIYPNGGTQFTFNTGDPKCPS